MAEKQEIIQTETPAKPHKRGCLSLLKRFWWAVLLAVVLIAVLVILLVIFVGVKSIAQQKVNQAKLDVQGVNMLQTTPNTFLLQINSTITTDGKLKADIDPFSGVMYLTDAGDKTPFLELDFPATNADKHQAVNITQEVNITHPDSFNRFNVWFFNNETLRITIEGRTRVKPGGLSRKYGVDFKKVVEVKGLNGFKNTTVTDGDILVKPVDGANFRGVARVPNPSTFTLDIGNTTFTNRIDDTTIGTLWINNMILRPGINEYPITANLDQIAIFGKTTSPQYCKTGVVPVSLHGTSVLNNGLKLPYYEAALGSSTEIVEMDIGSIIKSSLNVTISCPSS